MSDDKIKSDFEYLQNFDNQVKLLAEAIDRHLGIFTFRDKTVNGKQFRVSPGHSFWSELEKQPMLYTEILDEQTGKWLSYAKGTEAEINREKIPFLSWAPEVDDGSGFGKNGQRFATKEEAESAAKDIYSRWMSAKRWRVRPHVDPVNYIWTEQGAKSL